MLKKNKRTSLLFAVLMLSAALQTGTYVVSRFFIPLMGLCLFLLYGFKLGFNVISKSSRDLIKLHIIVFLLFCAFSIIGNIYFKEILFDYVKLFLAFGLSLSAILIIPSLSMEGLRYWSRVTLYIVLSLFFLDAVVRFNSFDLDFFLGNFYRYKLYSRFFFDSNALGLYLLIYFSFFLFLIRRGIFSQKRDKILVFLLYLACWLSFSRSVIISLNLLVLYHAWNYLGRASRNALLLIMICLFPYAIQEVYEAVLSDGSGLTKLLIFKDTFNKLFELDFHEMLFGHGINAGNYTFSYKVGNYAHALIPMLLGHFGIVGVILYFSFFIYAAIYSRLANLYLLIPMFISGLSYLHPFYESVFLVNMLIVSINNKLKYD